MYIVELTNTGTLQKWSSVGGFLKDNFTTAIHVSICILFLGIIMVKLNENIIDKITKLQKFKEFMNNSEESILILQEEFI